MILLMAQKVPYSGYFILFYFQGILDVDSGVHGTHRGTNRPALTISDPLGDTLIVRPHSPKHNPGCRIQVIHK